MGFWRHGPRRGVYSLMLGDLNANPGWATDFWQAPAALTILWDYFLQDTGPARCKPAAEVPQWTDERGCVGLIDHVLHGPAQKGGRLWVDEPSSFPSDHRSVVWDAGDVQHREDRPPVGPCTRHFQIRDPGIRGVYHAALSATRQETGPQPGDVADLYECFLVSTIRAMERAHGPPRDFGELPGRVDQVHSQVQAHAKRCPRWLESWNILKVCARTWLEPGGWGTCSSTSPISRPWPPLQGPLVGLLPIQVGSHAPGPTEVLGSHGCGAADQSQGGSRSGLSPPPEDAEGADAGGRQGPHREGHACTTSGFALGDGPPPPPHTPEYWCAAPARDQLQSRRGGDQAPSGRTMATRPWRPATGTG